MRSFYFKLSSIVLISCLGIIVYSNTFHFPFQFDDLPYIVENLFIQNLQDLQDLWKYYPCRFVTFLSFALNYHFHQLDVFGYHLFNLGVHLGTAILVWWFVLLTFSTPAMKDNKITRHANLMALLVGLVFVSHPLQTEAVTYVWQRASSLEALFYMASICFYIKSRLLSQHRVLRKSTATPGVEVVYYILSLITGIAAMFTKENSITLPLMVMLYEFNFFKTKNSFNWKYIVPFLFTLFIIPVTMFFIKSGISQLAQGVVDGIKVPTPIHYLLTQFRVMVTYVRLAFVPIDQNLDYDFPLYQNIFELPVLISLLFLTAILYFSKRLFLEYRLVSFSILWFFLTLLPESSFLPLRDIAFEHRLYLPLAGYSIFLVSGLYYLYPKSAIKLLVLALTGIIACNSVLTYQRNKVWRDEFTLWNDVVRKSPHKARAYYNLANAYEKQGNLAQALSDYNKAIELNPDYAGAFNNRGNIYDKLNNLVQAKSDYDKAIEIDPEYIDAYYNRGVIDTKQGDLTQAMFDFNKVIEINPNDALSYNYRGGIYAKQGDFTQSIVNFNKAIEINPQYAEAYYNRGLANYNLGIPAQAILDYNKAIAIDPQYEAAYYNRGSIYDSQGNFALAISDYTKAIDINPKYAEPYNNRGIIYAKQGNFTQAMPDLTKAIQINPKYAMAFTNRGLIYFYQGNFDQAMQDYDQAIGLDPNNADAYLNRGNVYAKQNDITHAISDYTKTIELNPQYPLAYSNRAISYYQLKVYDKAWLDAHKAEELGGTVDPQFIKALRQALGQGI